MRRRRGRRLQEPRKRLFLLEKTGFLRISCLWVKTRIILAFHGRQPEVELDIPKELIDCSDVDFDG